MVESMRSASTCSWGPPSRSSSVTPRVPWEPLYYEDRGPPPELLMLYASPLDQTPINVHREVEALEEALADSGSRFRLKVGVATAGSLTKLLTLARSRKGLVLHLSAHAIERHGRLGIVLEDGKAASHILWRENLEEILGVRERGLKNISVLFLSACSSEALAQIFVECGCRHVIATREKVHDTAARHFAQHLYLSLGVGQSLLAAWECARQALRIEANRDYAGQAEHFVLFGQHGADRLTLESSLGSEDGALESVPLLRELEDASMFLDAKLPPRAEHFVGRTQIMAELLHSFGGANSRRASVVHGPAGIGKSALGIELAHFASVPGRLFSCSVRIVCVDSCDLTALLESIAEEVESLAGQSRVQLRPCSASSRASLQAAAPEQLWSASPCSSYELRRPPPLPTKGMGTAHHDALASIQPVRQRLKSSLKALERARPRARFLVVLDDEAGAVSGCLEVQRLLGEMLENTYHLHILILSREPVYWSLGTTKVLNIPLKGLAEADATRLFLQRVHRPLGPHDFLPTSILAAHSAGGVGAAMVPPDKAARLEAASLRLRGHPLIQRLEGHPGRIREASSRVTPGGPSLLDLAAFLEPYGELQDVPAAALSPRLL